MERLFKGDTAALGELVRRYQQDILRFCVHYLRDVERSRELTQETFIRVHTARGRFDAKRKFRPWLLCIARNLCLNELKRRSLVPMESFEAREATNGAVAASSAALPDVQLMAEERRAVLAQVLDELDDDSREIVVLRFFEHMKTRDIAAVIGSTEGAVRTRLHRIMRKMRTLVEQRDDG